MIKIRHIPSGAVVTVLLVMFMVVVSLSESLVLAQIEIDPGLRPDEKIIKPQDYLEDLSDLNNTFFVKTSSQSEELAVKISNAAQLEAKGKWIDAALEYDAILKLADSTLAQMPGIDGERVYLGLKEYSRQRLKRFPPKGVAAYRLLVDRKVQERLAFALKNMDETAIREIVLNYPISGWADEALWYLADILYERANYNEAMYYYNRLLEEFDFLDASISIPVVYMKFAACAREIGHSALNTLRACLENLPAEIATKSVRVYDKQTHSSVLLNVRDYLIETERLLAAGVTESISGLGIEPEKFKDINLAWQTSQIRVAGGGYDARVWRDQLFVNLMGAKKTSANSKDRDASDLPYSEARVMGYDISTGKLNIPAQKYRLLDSNRAGKARQYFKSTICVDDTSFYFLDYAYRGGPLLPQQNIPMGMGVRMMLQHYVSELHACDKKDGKLKWAQPWEANHVGNRGGIDPAKARDFLNNMCITSAPVRYGAYLYVNVVRSLAEFNETYVACFNASNGVLMWYSHIGGEAFLNGSSQSQRRPEMGSCLTVVDNMVCFSTNMGVVGCASAETGDILWIAKYRVQPNIRGNANSFRRPAVQVQPFVWNPTPPKVVRDIKVTVRGKTFRADLMLVAPRDSDSVYAFDIVTGKRLWERNVSTGFPKNTNQGPRWINFTDKHVFVIQDEIKDTDSAGYKPRKLMVLEIATGKEIDFPKLVAKKCGRDILNSSKNLMQAKPYVHGRWLVLMTTTNLYCFDVEKDYALVADVKIDVKGIVKRHVKPGNDISRAAEVKRMSKLIQKSFESPQNIVLQGTRLFFMGAEYITCYELARSTDSP